MSYLPLLLPWLEARDQPQLWLDYFDAQFQWELSIQITLKM